MCKYLTLLVFGVVSATAFATPPAVWQPPKVRSDSVAVASVVKTVTVYKFFSKTCLPCRKFAPTFAAWRQRLAASKVRFVEIDGDDDANALRKYDVSIYPTVVVCDGDTYYKFDGAPDESLVVLALQKLGAAVPVAQVAPLAVAPAVMPRTLKTTTHSHRCGNCGTVWAHGPEARNDPHSHDCPTCGSGPWLRVHQTFPN